MRPVGGNAGKGPGGPDESRQSPVKRHKENERQVRRDADSSEEGQSGESPAKRSSPVPTVRPKAPPKEMAAKPGSSTHPTPNDTDPVLRSSARREAFKRSVAEDRLFARPRQSRRPESDLKSRHPELDTLQREQRLIDQAKAAGGHLEVDLSTAEEAAILESVLRRDSSIRSLKIICDAVEKPDCSLGHTASSGHGKLGASQLSPILALCSRLQALDISRCHLPPKIWGNLGTELQCSRSLKRLVVSHAACPQCQETHDFFRWLLFIENLRELIIEVPDTSTVAVRDRLGLGQILNGAFDHPALESVKLQGQHISELGIKFPDLFNTALTEKVALTHLSLAGSPIEFPSLRLWKQFEDIHANDFSHFTALQSLDLSHCGLTEQDSEMLAEMVAYFPALENIALEGNKISAAARRAIEATCRRNHEANRKMREPKEAQAAVAVDLLVNNAAQAPEIWPPELSQVLAEHLPATTLNQLTEMVFPAETETASRSATGDTEGMARDAGLPDSGDDEPETS